MPAGQAVSEDQLTAIGTIAIVFALVSLTNTIPFVDTQGDTNASGPTNATCFYRWRITTHSRQTRTAIWRPGYNGNSLAFDRARRRRRYLSTFKSIDANPAPIANHGHAIFRFTLDALHLTFWSSLRQASMRHTLSYTIAADRT